MTVDFERYARDRPIFWGDFEYPQIFHRAIAGCRGTYVDVGAGDGGQIRSALDRGLLAAFDRIVAVDISTDRIARVRTLLPEIDALVADAARLPLADASAGFIFSTQVIEHVADDRAMASEIARVLATDGRAVIGSVLRLRGAWYPYRRNGRFVLDPTHLREYTSPTQFAATFTNAGLRVDEIAVEPIRYPLSDLFTRALIALRLVKTDAAGSVYRRHPSLARLRRLTVAVPRYRHVFVLVTKPH
jgi:SAM-dependent methyltransferase